MADSKSNDAGFQGLMKSLNLDPQQYKLYNSSDFPQKSFQELSQIKTNIEQQLNNLFDLLKHQHNVDMDSPLVTKDGFPRSDIDVVSVRLIRTHIIKLKNDYKSLLDILESKMEEEFAKLKKAD
ncbi:NAS2 [Candida pseudojiufengensis]|uniref:NAS2 n=1 Tax=Candida pseudojiufengensis TaxID=497109 RepID=UPI002224FE7E|nr:NAS2 [Candida pseudojiufengensis]KAI5964867.1 NAS2 [Candida pseudojiufengensis]